jgi:hypothetical protein
MMLADRMLRDIQKTLAEHTKMFADHTRRFDRIELQVDDLHDDMVILLRLARHADVRSERMRKDIDDLKKRVKRLEAKR